MRKYVINWLILVANREIDKKSINEIRVFQVLN
jgi:hypothetical protein